jgi:hypothetical protein
MIEPFKYLIQPVALERDEGGQIKREVPGEVISVYSVAQAMEAITEFETLIEQQREGIYASGDSNGEPNQLRQPIMPGERVGPS